MSRSKIEKCLYGDQIFARVVDYVQPPPLLMLPTNDAMIATTCSTAVDDLQRQMERMQTQMPDDNNTHKNENKSNASEKGFINDASDHETTTTTKSTPDDHPAITNSFNDPLLNPPAPQSSSSDNNTNNILDVEENNGGGLAILGPRFKYSQVENVGVSKSPRRELNMSHFSIDYRKISHKIDIQELRRISSSGIPDEGSHRGVVWRVLLGYLPLDVSLWDATLKRERALYRSFLKELFISHAPAARSPTTATSSSNYNDHDNAHHPLEEETTTTTTTTSNNNEEYNTTAVPDHIREKLKRTGREALACINDDEKFNQLQLSTPENNAPSSSAAAAALQNRDPDDSDKGNEQRDWETFIDNAALLDEIRKDVIRTHPGLSFFLEPEHDLGQRRYAALERILFVWSKLNKGVRYVQGMNEIIGSIFFLLATDTNDEWAAEAEADSYFLFNIIMVEMRDVFVPDMDDSDTGIQGRISNMMSLLSLHDPLLRCHLQEVGIDGSFYSIRWLTTLLSREFALPETIRVWDSMFASTHKENFLRYFCVTMLMAIREELAVSDFGECLRLLQAYPVSNVDRLLESARALWIYESQITLACHKGGIPMNEALESVRPPHGIMMAYGLKGGVYAYYPNNKRQQVVSEKAMQQASKVMNSAHTTAVSYGRSFFGGANRLLNEWEIKIARVQEQVQESSASRRVSSRTQTQQEMMMSGAAVHTGNGSRNESRNANAPSNGSELLRPFGAVRNGGGNDPYSSNVRRSRSGGQSKDLLRQFPSNNGYT